MVKLLKWLIQSRPLENSQAQGCSEQLRGRVPPALRHPQVVVSDQPVGVTPTLGHLWAVLVVVALQHHSITSGSGTPVERALRPKKKAIIGGKAPHHDLMRGWQYIPYNQTMTAKLARENHCCSQGIANESTSGYYISNLIYQID